MAKIYIHIGTHKTGTTSLQHFLCDHRSFLRNEGYVYPATGVVFYGQHNVAWELINDERFDPIKGTAAELLEELKTAASGRHVILSSEMFQGAVGHSPAFASFVDDLKRLGFQPVIVVYLRCQDSYAQSLYFQLLKRGYDGAFSRFMEEIIETGCIKFRGAIYWFDYAGLIEAIRNSGCECRARPYLEYPRTHAVRDFCKLLGLKVDHDMVRYEDHPSLSLGESYELFLKNRHVTVPDVSAWFAARYSNAGCRPEIGPDLRGRLASRFNPRNKALEQYFKPAFKIRPRCKTPAEMMEQIFSEENLPD